MTAIVPVSTCETNIKLCLGAVMYFIENIASERIPVCILTRPGTWATLRPLYLLYMRWGLTKPKVVDAASAQNGWQVHALMGYLEADKEIALTTYKLWLNVALAHLKHSLTGIGKGN